MAIKYEYKSECCAQEYTEIRNADTPAIYTVCNSCGQGKYELMAQTDLD